MPAMGKHRRSRKNPITRGLVAAGTGGAVIALPLIGATGAHAAEKSAPAVAPERTVSVAQQVEAPKAPRTYTVAPGDTLAKIAKEQKVSGGWKKLYADNRSVVGANPSVIRPGIQLAIGANAKPKAAPAAAPAGKAAPAAKTRVAPFFAPVPSAVTTAYKTAGAMWSSGYHTGADFAAATGTSVKAVGAGTVVSAGWSGSYGNEVVIQHADGTYSQYAHLSQLSVSSGQSVRGGEQIGLSGSTGNSSGPHLHFEVRTTPRYGSDIDPLAYLRQHGVSI
ncbi:LysM peptidoglycan-binding domain-containing M23 family metallopeptidase [Streptomyces sp. NPDC000410]|uniref:M23 family metallopeptidase n=1 Tax=Streptomyces sp. NPDC000410 TaxID=3154254 RepID=UPI00333084A2